MRTAPAMRRAAFAAVLGFCASSSLFAYAQTPDAQRRAPVQARRTPPSAPPLPFAQETPPSGIATPAVRARALPPLPSYAQYLAGRRGRRPQSASGGTICINLSSGGTSCNPGGAGTSQDFPVNSVITWTPNSLPAPGGTLYQDYMMAPNTTTPSPVGVTYSDLAPLSHTLTLSAQGVYVLASLNQATNNWDAIVYVLTGTPAVLSTYSDINATQKSQAFGAGSAIYVQASGLTPTDRYVIAIDSTSVSGGCAFTFPASTSQVNAMPPKPCDASTAQVVGANAPGGTFFATWQTTSAQAGGTYSITLYDQTTAVRMTQQQIAIQGAGDKALALSATFSSSGQTKSNVSRIAFNGGAPFQDANASSVVISGALSGLTASRQYSLVTSDPNGTVLGNVSATASGTGAYAANAVTLNAQQSPRFFGPNVYTIALTDKNASNNPPTVLATRPLQVLGYTTSVAWSSGNVAISVNGALTPPSATSGITYTNDGESHFGVGNADPIAQFVTTSPSGASKYAYLDWASGATACAVGTYTTCSQSTETDSTGAQWISQIYCAGNGCTGYGNNSGRVYTIVSTPVTAGYGLPPNATLPLPDLNVIDASGNQCGSGCALSTAIQPLDGPSLSSVAGGSNIGNDITLLDNPSATYNLLAAVAIDGTRVAGTVQTNALAQGDTQATGYQPRYAQMVYANGQPRATSVAGIKEILTLNLNNQSGTGTPNISKVAVLFPSYYNVGAMTIDALSSGWAIFACPTGSPSNQLCLQTSVPLVNAASSGTHASTVYLDTDPPSASFVPSNVSVSVLNGSNVPFGYAGNPTGTATAVAAGTPATLTSLQLASYSLSSLYMTAAANPASVGQASSGTRAQSFGFQFSNTPVGSDAFPDDVDAVLVRIDPQSGTAVTWPTTWTIAPSNWTLVGSWPNGGGRDLLFGLCAAQAVQAALPTSSTFGGSIPTCSGSPNEGTDSLAPGSSFTANGSGTIGVGTGTITGRIYAHGTNGNGWSSGNAFSIGVVNGDAASAGFTKINGTAVATGAQPTNGGDPNPATGSAYEYSVTNTGGTPITTLTITVPGPDTSGASDQESGGPFFSVTSSNAAVLSALRYSGSGGSLTSCTGVTITNPHNTGTSPVVTAAGSIKLTGCSIPTGYTIVIPFSAKTPATVNSTYAFGTVFNAANTAASENWFADTQLKITLQATMSIILAPTGTGPSGTASANFAGCTRSDAVASSANLASYLDYGTVPAGVTETCSDAVLVSIATNAGGTVGWSLYVTADGNPSSVVSFAVDAAHSSTANNVSYANTTYSAVGTASPGQLLANRPSGYAAQRTPYDTVTSWKVVPADTLPHTQNLTFTFIAN